MVKKVFGFTTKSSELLKIKSLLAITSMSTISGHTLKT